MKSLHEAQEILLQDARHRAAASLSTEAQPLAALLNRVLAADVVSPIDVPAYDNSAMDGYAGGAADMNQNGSGLVVSQRIAAGHPGSPLAPGTVARIFTGAPIPPGADAVVMQEQAQVDEEGRVRFTASVNAGQNIRPRAGDLHVGQVILAKGRRLSAADVGLLASVGRDSVPVYAPLRVAVFSSGDEIRQPGESLGHGQIYDSNRPMIGAFARALGCDVTDMGCLPDSALATRAAIASAMLKHDVILTSGGVSVGEEDHIKSVIQELGSLDLWRLSIKPGKPFAFGSLGTAAFMGMPGNPVASWVTFALLVRPYLLARMGATAIAVQRYQVVAGFDWPGPDPRQEFLRGFIDAQGVAQIHDRQNSSVLSSVTDCTGLIEIPPATAVRKGESVGFIPYTALA